MPKIIGLTKRTDHTERTIWSISSGQVGPVYFGRAIPEGSLLVLAVQGRVHRFGGDAADLEDRLRRLTIRLSTEVEIDAWTSPVDSLIPHDSVLEARLARLEHLVNAMMDGKVSILGALGEEKIRNADAFDPRKLTIPVHATQRLTVVLAWDGPFPDDLTLHLDLRCVLSKPEPNLSGVTD